MNIYLKNILTEMCNRVGADFKYINFNENDWYLKYEWTLEEENSFIEWLINHLYLNEKINRELYNIPFHNKRTCERIAEGFRLNYCWKLKT